MIDAVIVIDGRQYDFYTSLEVRTGLRQQAREFSLQAETAGVDDIPFRKGMTVSISFAGTRVFNGFVEQIEMSMDDTGISYLIAGRDLLGDLVDSNLVELGDTGKTVKHAAEAALRHLGISTGVIDLADTASRPFERRSEMSAPEPGETAFEWLQDLARRRQALLTSDGDANLVITEGIGLKTDAKILHRKIDRELNNILSMTYRTSDSDRFGTYFCVPQKNVAALARAQAEATPRNIVVTKSSASDPAIRGSRVRFVDNESSMRRRDALLRAIWEANLSRAEGTQYQVTVDGLRDSTGQLWTQNTAPEVIDDFAGISAKMLLEGVAYRLGEEGETATLVFTDPEAFQSALNASEGQALG